MDFFNLYSIIFILTCKSKYLIFDKDMQTLTAKHKSKSGLLFLSIYIAFIIVGILHVHSFDFDQKSTFEYSIANNQLSDLTSDFFSVCSFHQFAHSIYHLHYSSSGITLSLVPLESRLNNPTGNKYLSSTYSLISPRAPPINS